MRIRLSLLGILLIGICHPLPILAQKLNLRFDRLGSEDGLSQMTINGIAQDHMGFMWFATQDGLNRFDGYKFKVYRNDPSDLTSLSSNDLRYCFVDSKGMLWIATDTEGLNSFDHATEKFTRFTFDPKNPTSISSNMIRWITEDSMGALWIATRNGGVSIFNRKTGTFKRYVHHENEPNSLASNNPLMIYEDSKGIIWITHLNHGLDSFDPKTETWNHYRHEKNNPTSLSTDRTWRIAEDSHGVLWIGTIGGGINSLDVGRSQFKRYMHDKNISTSLSNNFVPAVLEDSNGQLWLGTGKGGLNYLDRKTQIFHHYKNRADDQRSLSLNNVLTLFEDASGLLWVGTYGGGINIYDPRTQAFQLFQHQNQNENSLSNNLVLSMFEDSSGKIWIGTMEGGLNKLDLKSKKFTHYQHEENDHKSLGANDVWAIEEDAHNQIWVGTRNGGLSLLNQEKATFRHFQHDPKNPNSLASDFVWDLMTDSKGTLWVICFNGGLSYYDAVNNSFIHFTHDPTDPSSISSDNTKSVIESSDGALWITTEGGGLNEFNPVTQKFRRYQFKQGDPKSLISNNLMSVMEDSRGALWIGTDGNGMSVLDRTTGEFRTFSKKDGLENGSVYNILEDGQQQLWLSTNSGLFRFDLVSETFTHFDQSDGLQGNEFNRGAALKSLNGTLYFGGINGFNSFDPNLIQRNTFVPPVILTDLLLFNHPLSHKDSNILNQNLSFSEHITLDYTDYIIAFEFTALNFRQSKKNKYAYKLEGFDPDWIDTDANDRKSVYTNIPSGNYTFRVKASNDDGVWNEKGTSLEITVLPPWWKTWWAKSFYIFFLISIGPSIIMWRVIQLKKRQHELEVQVLERTVKLHEANTKLLALDEFKQNMMSMIVHDLKNPLNAILNMSLSNHVRQAGKQMLNMVLNILAVQKFEETKMVLALKQHSLKEVTDNALLQVAFLVEQKNITLISSVPNHLAVEVDAELIERVLVNLLTNAVKFSPNNGEISMNISHSKTHFVTIGISDSGEGIAHDKLDYVFEKFGQVKAVTSGGTRSTGLGLTFCKLAIEAHGGEIGVTSIQGKGSTFFFELPEGTMFQDSLNEVEIEKISGKEVKLTEHDRQVLVPFLSQLQDLLVYDTTLVEGILNQIQFGESNSLSVWKDEMNSALYAMNETKYLQLLDQIITRRSQ